MEISKLVSTEDFFEAAKQMLGCSPAWGFLESGSDDEFTVSQNIKAFQRWVIRPRALQDVSSRSLTTLVFGKPISFPVAVAPTAMQKAFHPLGEIATAKAAEKAGTIFVLSTLATCSIEEVAKAAPNLRRWFQLYYQHDRAFNEQLLRRAEEAGYEAVVLTVDAQLLGRRRVNIKRPLILPDNVKLANFHDSHDQSKQSAVNTSSMDPSLNWKDINWIRQKTAMKVILKGIVTSEDAKLALEHGVAGIIVSNHGGRQLGSILPSIDALPEVVNAVQGRCEIFVDGGFRMGTDVYKALALGAKAVFLGRPVLCGLIVDGENGVAKVLDIYKNELDTTMALSGVTTIEEINANRIQAYSPL